MNQKGTNNAVGSPLFELSDRDIAELNDSDFRELVARLCKAALASAHLPVTWVTWGGDQREPDGGIDVRVTVPEGFEIPVDLSNEDPLLSELHRRAIGFQVKRTKMPPSAIKKEMQPRDRLQESIQQLVCNGGAYIIAAYDSIADKRLGERVSAMREATKSVSAHEKGALDYYDRRRLADWASHHPSVVAWVSCKRHGHSVQGWRPYENWSGEKGNKFLIDVTERFHEHPGNESALSLLEGIHRVREVLRQGGQSVRLLGMSGVGKTRFVQALFEAEVGEKALSAEWAVYTDTGHSPSPSPLGVLESLLADQRRAVLVVDNCGGDLHRTLTDRLKKNGNPRVSVITVEYDIQEDIPSSTKVFSLQAASDDLVQRLLKQRCPKILPVNSEIIARFSGGNSRIALALAQSIDVKKSVASLSDAQLFDRLFWQRQNKNSDLERVAEVCSLLYSFDFSDESPGEVGILAEIGCINTALLRRYVSELKRRGLAQERGKWVAILPQAVANKLAERALDYLSIYKIEKILCSEGSRRMLRSFSRRLGYLHESSIVREIVHRWLSGKGEVDLFSLDSTAIRVLSNISPVDPSFTLEFFEQALREKGGVENLYVGDRDAIKMIAMLCAISYEKTLFSRSLKLLLDMAIAGASNDVKANSSRLVKSLFQIYLSGTHATVSQRMDALKGMLMSDQEQIRSLAVDCLSSALKVKEYESPLDFSFGSRKRDYGWWPDREEKRGWLEKVICLSVEVGGSEEPVSVRVRKVLADNFRCLWGAGMESELERASKELKCKGWEEGWVAVRNTLYFDDERLSGSSIERLRNVETLLKPINCRGWVRSVVLGVDRLGTAFADPGDELQGGKAGEDKAYELGKDFGKAGADDEEILRLVTELLSMGACRHKFFGQGMARAVPSVEDAWERLVGAFESWPKEQREVETLCGFLSGVFDRDPDKCKHLMEGAMSNPSLVRSVPRMMRAVPFNERTGYLLLTLVGSPDVSSADIMNLRGGNDFSKVSDGDLAEFFRKLMRKDGGVLVAVELAVMNIDSEGYQLGEGLRSALLELMGAIARPMLRDREDGFYVAKLIRLLFKEDDRAFDSALLVLMGCFRGDEGGRLSLEKCSYVIRSVLEVRPFIALDFLVGEYADWGGSLIGILEEDEGGVLSDVPLDELLAWCHAGDVERWSNIVPWVQAIRVTEDGGRFCWSNTARSLLEKTPNPLAVAEKLVDFVFPNSWSGSRVEAIRRRLPLLDDLEGILGSDSSAFVERWRQRIQEVMKQEEERDRRQQKGMEHFDDF